MKGFLEADMDCSWPLVGHVRTERDNSLFVITQD